MRKFFKMQLTKAVALPLALVAAMSLSAALGQVPSIPPSPLNIDLGALITNTAQGAGIVSSVTQNNTFAAGTTCTFVMTGFTGNPVVNFQIQNFDSASSTWNNLLVSPAITASQAGAPVALTIGRSGQTSPAQIPTLGYGSPFTFPLPANSQTLSFPLARNWRVQEIISGSGTPTVTGTIGCVMSVI
jgi:hypothetical protein